MILIQNHKLLPIRNNTTRGVRSKGSQFNANELLFGTKNVCGLERRLHYPEVLNIIDSYDIVCIVETKLDNTDVISVPGYTFLSQHRKQRVHRKSGGIDILYKDSLCSKVKLLETDSDYILWVQIDKQLFNIEENMLWGIFAHTVAIFERRRISQPWNWNNANVFQIVLCLFNLRYES